MIKWNSAASTGNAAIAEIFTPHLSVTSEILHAWTSTTGLTNGLQSFEWFVSQTFFTGALESWDDRSLLKLGIAARNLHT